MSFISRWKPSLIPEKQVHVPFARQTQRYVILQIKSRKRVQVAALLEDKAMLEQRMEKLIKDKEALADKLQQSSGYRSLTVIALKFKLGISQNILSLQCSKSTSVLVFEASRPSR